MNELIQSRALLHGLKPELVLAICKVESDFNPKAIRFEPHWTYQFSVSVLAHKCKCSYDTEKFLQACSFGVMQIMGTVARELGFDEPLVNLLELEKGLEFGCLKLKKLSEQYDKLEDVISAYNQGSALKSGDTYKNFEYVDKVMHFINNGI
jgi:soluble lytic murein transglycosylase-like protein